MYGDTSELHFLQTTKSSGPLATQAILRARPRAAPKVARYSGSVAAAISRTTSWRSWLAW